MEKIDSLIDELVDYSIVKGLTDREDACYAVNSLLMVLGLDSYSGKFDQWDGVTESEDRLRNIYEILGDITDWAAENNLLPENTVTYRDLFDTKVIGSIMKAPSAVNREFREKLEVSPEEATKYFYNLSCSSNYIRKDRIARDVKWKTATKYGDLDITINLSKPEKDPKAIAAAKNAKNVKYPRCQLCLENEGYSGRLDHPARENHRIIRTDILGETWGFQYSPYVYFNEHCIVFNSKHVPMKIDRSAFQKLFSFIKQFPHYFLGSNADLPIVGGSILAHEHFQGGHYEFAMAKAGIREKVVFKGYEDVDAGIVNWPMSVIRISSADTERLVELGSAILCAWRKYTDKEAFIFAETENTPHNTITPIARFRNGRFELDLVLRNNITTKEHPLGVFHPWEEYHHIKKENIGLIEVMGLAVLPARLKEELSAVEEKLVDGSDFNSDERTVRHGAWASDIRDRYDITPDNVQDIVRKETGLVFMKVLECAGVFKDTDEGHEAFRRFVSAVNSGL